MGKYAILYSERLKEYDLGHVLTQERYQDFMDLFNERLGSHLGFEVKEPPIATDEDLMLVHTGEYISRIERLEERDPFDTPLSPGLVRAARLLAGAGKYAGELVFSGEFEKAFVVGGGVQHANRERERGFGVFSDVGVCAVNLMENFGVERVMIIDTDAHAGEGIYDIFEHDPSVLFISIHQDPRTVYPGRGFVGETGKGDGTGFSVNIPLAPGSGERAYEHVLKEVFFPLADEFRPEVILMVDGSDPLFTDRITQMGLTLGGIKRVGELISRKAGEVCRGRVVDFVGSGYSAQQKMVSLGWLASISGVTGVEVELEELVPAPAWLGPDAGLERAKEVAGQIKAGLSGRWECFAG